MTASANANSRTATYAYYAVPILGKDGQPTNYVLITNYMTNRGWVAGKGNDSTWGPSFIVEIMPNGTTRVVPGSVTKEQGVWVLDDGTEFTPTDNGSAVKVIEANKQGKAHGKKAASANTNTQKIYYDAQKHNLVVSNENTVQLNVVNPSQQNYAENAKKAVAKKASTNGLPQTGEATSNKSVWGMISMALAGILAAFGLSDKKRRN